MAWILVVLVWSGNGAVVEHKYMFPSQTECQLQRFNHAGTIRDGGSVVFCVPETVNVSKTQD